MTGFYEDRIGRVASAAERHIGPDKLSGVVVLLSRYGELSYLKSFGLLSRETESRMRTDAIFRIYSMTKPITSVAALMLYEEGMYQLGDPISRYLPDAKNLKVLDEESGNLVDMKREITFHDLFTHTSGFTYHFAEWGKVEEQYRGKGLAHDIPLDEFIAELFKLPLAFQPGAQFRYSFSCDVLARLVEIMSGMRFADYLNERIFGPLEMNDTGFFAPTAKHKRFASMYGSANILTPNLTGTEMWTEAAMGKNILIAGPKDSHESQPHMADRGGHGLVSTAEDYWRFSQMLLNGGVLNGERLLSPKIVELMTRNHLLPHQIPIVMGPEPSWGVGFGLGVQVIEDTGLINSAGTDGAYGWGGAATTSFMIDPREQLIGVVMAQFQPSGFHPVEDDVKVAVYQALTVE